MTVQQDTKGEPVAWWRISYIDPDGNSDADVQIGKNKPTAQILADNGFEWEPLYALPHPVQPEEAVARELTSKEIKDGWEATFSTNNPFCPCDLKSFTKAVNWAQWKLAALSRDAGGAEG